MPNHGACSERERRVVNVFDVASRTPGYQEERDLMTHRTTLLLAAAATLMTAAGSASAAFMGLTAESYVGADWVVNGYDESSLDTYRVYANFDNPLGTVTAIGDNGGDGLSFLLESSSNAFFNDAAGTDLAPDPLFLPFAPALRWDTYMTIGEEFALPGGIRMTFSTPTFTPQAGGLAQSFTLDDAGLFSLFAPMSDRVLLAQITVEEGATITAENWVISGFDGQASFESLSGFTTAIPSPGALALLGLAGLMGRRRGRAA